jgi:hypothetical protein
MENQTTETKIETLPKEKQKINTSTKILLGSIGALAFLVIAGVGSLSYAANTTDTTATAFIDRVAQIAGVDASKLKNAFNQVSTEDVDKRLAAGEITQEEATRMKEGITNGKFFGGFTGGPRGGTKSFMHFDIESLAQFFGLTPEELEKKEHTDGQTWLQIAQAQGKSEADLKNFLSEQLDKNLADAVSKGNVTEEMATKMKADKDTMITRMISDNHDRGPKFHTEMR